MPYPSALSADGWEPRTSINRLVTVHDLSRPRRRRKVD
jgi:hypothetical protein